MSKKRQQRTYLALALTLVIALGVGGYLWLGHPTPAAATSLYQTERQRIGFGGIFRYYGTLDSYPNSLAQLNAGWYTDYWWGPDPSQPNGAEYPQLIYIEDFGWTRYQSSDGLANKIVYAVAAESANHLWFGTADGVSELDGSTWTTYKTTNGLVNNVVRTIAIDADGNKWFGTDGGVSKFDGSTWTNYTRANTGYKLLSNTIYAIAVEGTKIWIASAGGVNRLIGTAWAGFTNGSTGGGLLSNTVLSIAIEGTTKWFGTTAGACKFTGSAWTGYTTANGLASNRVQAIAIDGDTKWFGTNNGISSLNGSTWTTYRVANTNGVLSDDIRAMALDGEGNLWCGTMGGVNKYDGEMWSGYPAFDSRDTVCLASNWVYAVAVDASGRKWFGTDSGGANVFDDLSAWNRLASVLAAKPGSLFIIGNEPDSPQDVSIPPIYAQRYHEFYTFVKSHDPTAQVATTAITEPTPLRMQWVNDMVAEYEERYGEFIPVDVWNIHELILRESYDSWGCSVPMNPVTRHYFYGVWNTDTTYLPLYCKNSSGNVEYCRYDSAGNVAAGQTQIRSNTDYDGSPLYETWDNASFAKFQEHIRRFREWMKAHGEQDKPLIITELGVTMPDNYLYPPGQATSLQYMRDTFEYMLGHADESLGCPSDGYRLVQRWLWFSLNAKPKATFTGEGYNGSLVYDNQWDPQGRNDVLTPFGELFARYANNAVPEITDFSFSGRSAQPGDTFLIHASFHDFNGVGQLDDVYALLNTDDLQKNGIYLRYDPDANKVYMRNLADTTWMGGFAPGSASTAYSSYATLLGQQCSAQVVGDTLNVTWAISFNTLKENQLLNVYLKAQDKLKMFVGWDNVWDVFVGFKQFAPLLVTPAGDWTEPDIPMLFTAVYEDAAGVDAIRYADLMLNLTPDPTFCVAVRYDVQNDLMYLHAAPRPTVWRPPLGVHPADGGEISHIYGKVYISGSSVAKEGNTLTVTWALQFSWRMSGKTLNMYMDMTDVNGVRDGWHDYGNFTVNRKPNYLIPPTREPFNSSTTAGTLVYLDPAYRDMDGYRDLEELYILVTDGTPSMYANGSAVPAGVYLRYQQSTNSLYIWDKGKWQGPYRPFSTPSPVSTTYASLVTRWSKTILFDVNTLKLLWRLSFNSNFLGKHKVFMRAIDKHGVASDGDTGWKWKGSVTVLP